MRTDPAATDALRDVLARIASPEQRHEVGWPSAAAPADFSFTGLLLGLGAMALRVGGIRVASTMVVSWLQRRAEIEPQAVAGATCAISASSSSAKRCCWRYFLAAAAS